MESRSFWRQLCDAVTCRDWQRLEQNDPTVLIGPFNRETLLRMRETEPPSFDIPEASIQGLSELLRRYLERYMAEQPEGHRWIILSCLYLSLVLQRPMHPQDVVHWTCRTEQGRLAYHCPCKEYGEESVCTFCVCQGE